MTIFADERLLALGVVNGTASRAAGSGREAANTSKLFAALGLPPQNIHTFKQVHGDKIIPILSPSDALNYDHEGDAWLLAPHNHGCMILTADCVPLFVWDDRANFIALAHCGWRGVAAGLPGKVARAVAQKAGANAKLCAAIGPHIHSCCFEVKEDVAQHFAPAAIIHRESKIFVDLAADIKRQLKQAGLNPQDINHQSLGRCTCCGVADYFSYRRDGTKDALISFIYKL